jgi:predicted GNAT family acetyltransferase
VNARQRELGQPEALEWVVETAPALVPAAEGAGLRVEFKPLLALTSTPAEVSATGVTVRVLDSDDVALPAAIAAVDVGFQSRGTAIGQEGVEHRDLRMGQLIDRIDFVRRLIQAGHQIVVAAETTDGPVAAGTAIPRGGVAELAGIATLPAWRRRGIAALVTSELARAARVRGAELLMLSADSDAVARVYEGIGFERVGSVGEASPPAPREV